MEIGIQSEFMVCTKSVAEYMWPPHDDTDILEMQAIQREMLEGEQVS